MAKQSLVFLFSILGVLLAGTAMAQDASTKSSATPSEDEKSFNLIVGDEGQEDVTEDVLVESKYIPAIEKGQWDLTLTLGYFNMNKTLLEYDRIIYKSTDEALYYGDVKLVNESAFNPILRLGYSLTRWLVIEVQGGVTFSQYTAEITDPWQVDPAGGNPTPVLDVGEFDAENRSVLIFLGNVNALWYPLDMIGDGVGRWHPYVTAGGGMSLYNIDSDYVDDPATNGNVNVGIGLKLIADQLISVRFELLYQMNEVQFTPAEYFDSRDEDTKQTPVYEFDEAGRYTPVESFSPEALDGITWQIGFSIRL